MRQLDVGDRVVFLRILGARGTIVEHDASPWLVNTSSLVTFTVRLDEDCAYFRRVGLDLKDAYSDEIAPEDIVDTIARLDR